MSPVAPKKIWNGDPPPVGVEYHNAFGITLGLNMPASDLPSPLKSDVAFVGTAKLSTTLAAAFVRLVIFAVVPMPRAAKPAQISAMSAAVPPPALAAARIALRACRKLGLTGSS